MIAATNMFDMEFPFRFGNIRSFI